MASDYVGFRMPPDMRAQIETICQATGLTLSEWVRGACYAAISNGANGFGGVEEGYLQGRALAIQLAHAAVDQARALLPGSYEEAIARFGGIAGPGRGGAG